MSFVTLNGVEFAIDAAKVDRTDTPTGGGKKRAFDGTLNDDRSGFKRVWSLTSAPDSQANINYLRLLLNDTAPLLSNSGDHWQFDNGSTHLKIGLPWSDKGSNAVTLTNSALVSTPGSGAWPTGGKINLPLGGSIVLFNGYAPAAGFVAGLWHNDAGTFNPYLFFGNSSSVTTFKAGVQIANPSFIGGSVGGALKIVGTGVATDAISDVWVYPFLPPTTWVAGLAARQAAAQWPVGGTLQMGGDLGTAVVMAYAPGSTIFPSQLPGQVLYTDSNEKLAFNLWEV